MEIEENNMFGRNTAPRGSESSAVMEGVRRQRGRVLRCAWPQSGLTFPCHGLSSCKMECEKPAS